MISKINCLLCGELEDLENKQYRILINKIIVSFKYFCLLKRIYFYLLSKLLNYLILFIFKETVDFYLNFFIF